MKRATREWLVENSNRREGFSGTRPLAIDALDSEKRLKAEVRRLRGELGRIAEHSGEAWSRKIASAALRPTKRKPEWGLSVEKAGWKSTRRPTKRKP